VAKRPTPEDRSDIDAYLASVPAEARVALQNLRAAIHAAAPGAEEGFSYGVPGFRIDGRPLVCFAAFKNHCGFYPMSPAVLRAHAAELAKYETSAGTIRFAPDTPLPAALVKKIVKARMAEVRASGGRAKTRSAGGRRT